MCLHAYRPEHTNLPACVQSGASKCVDACNHATNVHGPTLLPPQAAEGLIAVYQKVEDDFATQGLDLEAIRSMQVCML